MVGCYGIQSLFSCLYNPFWWSKVHVTLTKVDAVRGQVYRTESFQLRIFHGEYIKPYLKIDQTSCASALPSFKRDEKGMRLLLSILVDALLCEGVAMYDLMSLKDVKMRRCGLKEQRSMGDQAVITNAAIQSGTSDVLHQLIINSGKSSCLEAY